MSQPALPEEYRLPFKLNVQETKLTEEQFIRLCQENPELRIELTAQQELVIMPPTGAETGRRNNRLAYRVTAWADIDGSGIVFDSSTLFALPNGAKRSPDVSWVRRERWDILSKEQREGFAPLCPDFAAELRSPTDRLRGLQEKMPEYIDNGARLGWLIDPLEKRVYIYRPGQPVEVLDDPPALNGEPV
ncbi:MAG TPA: Uma2 family endonuclease, partial [Candidatus Binatia bacterium]|nr:Uma2 family endonuclease [Candidatus Binatia bacterium]